MGCASGTRKGQRSSELCDDFTKPYALERSLELQTTRQDRVVSSLTFVTGDSGELHGAVDGHIDAIQGYELRSHLGIERFSDVARDAPLEDGKVVACRDSLGSG